MVLDKYFTYQYLFTYGPQYIILTATNLDGSVHVRLRPSQHKEADYGQCQKDRLRKCQKVDEHVNIL